jgi:hypothetical protein
MGNYPTRTPAEKVGCEGVDYPCSRCIADIFRYMLLCCISCWEHCTSRSLLTDTEHERIASHSVSRISQSASEVPADIVVDVESEPVSESNPLTPPVPEPEAELFASDEL